VFSGRVVAEEQHVTRLKWWTPAQFTDLLIDAGFEDVSITDGFSVTPADPDSQGYIGVARTPQTRLIQLELGAAMCG